MWVQIVQIILGSTTEVTHFWEKSVCDSVFHQESIFLSKLNFLKNQSKKVIIMLIIAVQNQSVSKSVPGSEHINI